MAFEKKVWADRIAEYINRRLLTKEDGTTELVTVARNEGTVSQEGDAFNAENMNDLEERIAAEFDSQNEALAKLNSSLLKYLPMYYIVSATAGTTTEIPIEYNNLHMYRVTVGEYGTYGGISDKYGQYLLSEGSSFIVQASTAVEAISESLDSSKILITWKTSSYKTVIVEKLDR